LFTPAETSHAVAEIDMQGRTRKMGAVDLEADFRGKGEASPDLTPEKGGD
jgi:hypothetical protein